MAEQAQVTSVEAIEAFRAELILFLSKVRPVLEEVSDEVMRLQAWLQNDQRRFWESERRKRGLKLEEAKQELFNAALSHLQEATALQHMAVQRAQRAVRDAEEKLDTIKKWERGLEDRTAPLVKQIEEFHGFLITDMGKAIAQLVQIVKTLDAYAKVGKASTEGAQA
jgi:type I site-specific restriction-modification system R (restriction) subunit